MECVFQLLDADYILVNGKPVIRLFGKTPNGKTVCVFYENFRPYFYVLPKDGKEKDVIDFLKKNFSPQLDNIKNVKKFLPIGFSEKKTDLLKVFLKNPASVPEVRDSLLKSNLVKNVYEADIPFKYRFMADFNIFGMRWYKVHGKSTTTNTVDSQIKIMAEKIEEVKREGNADLKFMSIDIEVVPGKEGLPDSKNDPISIISISFYPAFNGKNTLVLTSRKIKKFYTDILSFETEKEMLQKFVEIIKQFDPDIITGYNCDQFDLPYISDRLRANRIKRNIGRCNQKPMICRNLGGVFRNSIPGRAIADVYFLIREAVGKGLLRLKRYGLGDVSSELLGEGKVDISHSEISTYWNGEPEKVKKLLEYARKDAELALRLLLERQMLDKFIAISQVSGILLQDSLHCSESIRIENLLLREFNKRDFIIPDKPSNEELRRRREERKQGSLKGALVLSPDTGLHKYVVYLDFRSLYPSIYYAYNICPTTLVLEDKKGLKTLKTPFGTKFVPREVREGIVPTIVFDLIEKRSKVKKQMKEETDPEKKRLLNAKQLALKYVANAFYGYTGYLKARFYVLDIANAITSCGRDILTKTKEFIENETHYKVIYGDTDSFMIKTDVDSLEEAEEIGEKLVKMINDQFKGIIKVKIESIFKTLLILAKKRYTGWSFEKVNGKWEEKIITKGIETVRRDWCDLVSETLYDVLDIVLKKQNPEEALTYVRDVMNKLREGKIPLEKLTIVKGISKPLHKYKGIQPHVELVKKMIKRDPSSAPGVGDRVGFVIVKGLQLVSKRAEDPEYVKEHNLQVDYNYYIENQLLPPLERVFEVLNISKSQLLGAGKQMGLLEAIKTKKDSILEESLKAVEGFICGKCETTYRRVPLQGKCTNCGGEILFYYNNQKSKFFTPSH
jgi:DNA polymerase I